MTKAKFFGYSSGSVLAAAGSIVGSGSPSKPFWFGIVAPLNGGASGLVFDDTACTVGREIAHLAAGPSSMGPIIGPFFSSCALYVAGLTTSASINVFTSK